jgi:hypothetical protein
MAGPGRGRRRGMIIEANAGPQAFKVPPGSVPADARTTMTVSRSRARAIEQLHRQTELPHRTGDCHREHNRYAAERIPGTACRVCP